MDAERLEKVINMILPATWETLYMTFLSSLIALVLGTIIGLILNVTDSNGVRPNKPINAVLGFIVNFGRSVPFIILLIAVIPFTRFVVGTSLGMQATVVPLVIAATPYIARLIESSLKEVDQGVIEAAQAMGANTWQIIMFVLVPETVPSLIVEATIATTTIISYTAMAGTVAGGGLGALAISHGYQRYETDIMVITVLLLVVIVQLVQFFGDILSKKLDKRVQ